MDLCKNKTEFHMQQYRGTISVGFIIENDSQLLHNLKCLFESVLIFHV